MAADISGKIIVVGQRGGVISVHDSDDGILLGTVGSMGETPSVAVAKAPDQVFLILVATGKRLTAYYSTPMDQPAEQSAEKTEGAEGNESE